MNDINFNWLCFPLQNATDRSLFLWNVFFFFLQISLERYVIPSWGYPWGGGSQSYFNLNYFAISYLMVDDWVAKQVPWISMICRKPFHKISKPTIVYQAWHNLANSLHDWWRDRFMCDTVHIRSYNVKPHWKVQGRNFYTWIGIGTTEFLLYVDEWQNSLSIFKCIHTFDIFGQLAHI